MNAHEIPERFRATLCSPAWLIANAERLQGAFPEHWTPMPDVNAFAVGASLIQVGVPWQTEAELAFVLEFLQRVGIMRMGVGSDRSKGGEFRPYSVPYCQRGPLVLRHA